MGRALLVNRTSHAQSEQLDLVAAELAVVRELLCINTMLLNPLVNNCGRKHFLIVLVVILQRRSI